ncbi:MAG: flotillin family protein [Candidatus Eremiobacteraeota bacterium]|nr:flotillin family protein [Candidatus Eremiobacteraeota bacterium]
MSLLSQPLTPIAIAALSTGAFALVLLVFRAMWRVPAPNEALLVSGLRSRPRNATGSLGFKIATGSGTLMLPGFYRLRRLSLELHEAELAVDCVTQQGIPLRINAVVSYKVGDDHGSIASAARRFLDQQHSMDARVQNLLAGQIRAICGSLTVEDLIRQRNKLTEMVRASAVPEMETFGLVIDSLQIGEIEDSTGYIEQLARPHVVAVAKEARIAQAHADRQATEVEAAAEAIKAQALRDSRLKQADCQGDVERAEVRAKLAGGIVEADLRRQMALRDTEIAQIETERELAAAEAKRQQMQLHATAQASAIRQIAEAEAAAVRVRGSADGEAIRSRGEAHRAIDRLPSLVDTAAKALGEIDKVLARQSGPGVDDRLRKIVEQGVTGLRLARTLLGPNEPAPNGAPPTIEPVRAESV